MGAISGIAPPIGQAIGRAGHDAVPRWRKQTDAEQAGRAVQRIALIERGGSAEAHQIGLTADAGEVLIAAAFKEEVQVPGVCPLQVIHCQMVGRGEVIG
ncbi:MAG: hypothetical protein CFE32_22590, partial [Alphaproteobacteria bacterium PA3]